MTLREFPEDKMETLRKIFREASGDIRRIFELAVQQDMMGAMKDAADGIDPEANPYSVVSRIMQRMAGVAPREPVKEEKRGCRYPGRFDREDNSRDLGWGPAPGKGPCDYPRECPGYGKEEMSCPFAES